MLRADPKPRDMQIYHLQGNLVFGNTEPIVHDIMENLASFEYLVLDFRQVLSINESACRLLHDVLGKLDPLGKSLVLVHTQHLPLVRRYLKARLKDRFVELYRHFDDSDFALEWCENRLLEARLPQPKTERRAEPKDYELLEHLSGEELAALIPRLETRRYRKDETIIQAGDAATHVYFLAKGKVSVLIPLESGTQRRLATFSTGMVFGEMAIIDHAPRSATIRADTEVECDLLSAADFAGLSASHPQIQIKLLASLCLGLCRKLRKANLKLNAFQ